MRGRETFDDSTDRWSRTDWWGVVLDAPDAPSLARFYSELLGWPVTKQAPEYCTVAPDDGVGYLGFQTATDFVRPTWPNRDGTQQMMLHLDFEVVDLAAAAAHAMELGAEQADHQPQADVRVMLDPVGHPFCLYASQ